MKLKYKNILIVSIICFLIILLLGFFIKIPIIGNALVQFVNYEQYFTLRKSKNITLTNGKFIFINYNNKKIKCKITKVSSDKNYWTFQIDKFLMIDSTTLMKDVNITLEKCYLFSYLFSYII